MSSSSVPAAAISTTTAVEAAAVRWSVGAAVVSAVVV